MRNLMEHFTQKSLVITVNNGINQGPHSVNCALMSSAEGDTLEIPQLAVPVGKDCPSTFVIVHYVTVLRMNSPFRTNILCNVSYGDVFCEKSFLGVSSIATL